MIGGRKMAVDALARSTRRKTSFSFSLPVTLLKQLDQLAVATGQSKSRLVEDLLDNELERFPSEVDPDVAVCELRQNEPDIPLEECTEIFDHVQKILAK